MTSPVVSAIMPAYNAGATIRAAIRSIQNQDWRDWELIVLDDGSVDNTLDEAKRLADGDSRISVFTQPRSGRGYARNACLARCRGAWVAICDADDISLPQRFSAQLASVSQSGADVSTASVTLALTHQARPAYRIRSASTPSAIFSTLKRRRMPIQFATTMIRKATLNEAGGFDAELHRNQDFGFFLRHYRRLSFAIIPDPLILYRLSAVSATYGHLKENNFYRSLAIRRALGDVTTATQARAEMRTRLAQRCVVPLQYFWFRLKREVLGAGIEPFSDADRALIATTLSAVND